jgi:hypothetical protein
MSCGLARADRNGDGRIEWDEMLAFARQTPVPPNSVGGSIMSTILSMDENRDGSVTREEFDRAIERIFRLVDTDRDDILSRRRSTPFEGARSSDHTQLDTMSGSGTFETCPPIPRMSVHRGRPEVTVVRPNRRQSEHYPAIRIS